MRALALRLRLSWLVAAVVALVGLGGALAAPAFAAVRTATRISAGPVRHVNLGGWTTVAARLTTAAGRPVGHAPMWVQGIIGGHWRTVGRVWTNPAGWAVANLRPGYTTDWAFAFTGNGADAPARSNAVAVYVTATRPAGRQAAHLDAGPMRHINLGQWTTVAGRLTNASGQYVAGAYLRVQGLIGGVWRTVGAVHTNVDGLAIANLRPGYTTTWKFVFPGNGTYAPAVSNQVPVYVAGKTPAQVALAAAAAERGKPYRWGAAGPNAFDCSGLAEFAWARTGVALPHNALLQFERTRHIALSALRPGDLVFSASGNSTNWRLIDHVGVYAGHDYWWVAPHTGTVVQLQHIYTSHVWATAP